MNGGIVLRMILSMLLTGLYQFYQNILYGLWYARPGKFVEVPLIQNLARLRSVGGNLFVSRPVPMAWFMMVHLHPLVHDEGTFNSQER